MYTNIKSIIGSILIKQQHWLTSREMKVNKRPESRTDHDVLMGKIGFNWYNEQNDN